MKNILYMAASLLLCLMTVSCSKEDIGGTATEKVAGQWYVSVDGVDENDEVIPGFEDFFYDGRKMLLTYNTADNNPNEMIVDDLGNIWEFKVKTVVDQNAKTFQTTTTENNNMWAGYEDINVTISGGKILPKAGRQNNGSPADSIVFYVSFSDDTYPAKYGHTRYKVSGIRYSGLAEND